MSAAETTRESRTVRVLIAGHVQGVAYRAWTRRTATTLGLSGWVRNRRDGAVEALFSGAPADVDEMLRRCREGPPAARVANLSILQEGGIAPMGFKVLPTL